MKSRMKEIIRFVFTGGICFIIEYAALVVLKEGLRLSAVAATPIAFLISVFFNYLLCVRWVFPGAVEGSRAAQVGFVITSLMGFFLNWAIMWGLTALFGEDTLLFSLLGLEVKVYMVNKVVTTGLVMVWNYFTKRYVLRGGRRS